MAKYYGAIGYYFDEAELRPGVWGSKTEERTIFGDIYRSIKRTENPGQVNDNININNQISFIADTYAIDNFQHIKYATFMGVKWAVVSAEIAYPRLILNLGGVYNGE